MCSHSLFAAPQQKLAEIWNCNGGKVTRQDSVCRSPRHCAQYRNRRNAVPIGFRNPDYVSGWGSGLGSIPGPASFGLPRGLPVWGTVAEGRRESGGGSS